MTSLHVGSEDCIGGVLRINYNLFVHGNKIDIHNINVSFGAKHFRKKITEFSVLITNKKTTSFFVFLRYKNSVEILRINLTFQD